MNNCPCGSGNTYAGCCEPVIGGVRPAATATELMRARYTAHVVAAVDFIFASTHPDQRQGYDAAATKTWAESSEWLGLEIVDSHLGGADDASGAVEFIARFREKSGLRNHHERAQFQREQGLWYFCSGEMVRAKPLVANKVGRNEPCPCGSGRKHKKCCGV